MLQSKKTMGGVKIGQHDHVPFLRPDPHAGGHQHNEIAPLPPSLSGFRALPNTLGFDLKSRSDPIRECWGRATLLLQISLLVAISVGNTMLWSSTTGDRTSSTRIPISSTTRTGCAPRVVRCASVRPDSASQRTGERTGLGSRNSPVHPPAGVKCLVPASEPGSYAKGVCEGGSSWSGGLQGRAANSSRVGAAGVNLPAETSNTVVWFSCGVGGSYETCGRSLGDMKFVWDTGTL